MLIEFWTKWLQCEHLRHLTLFVQEGSPPRDESAGALNQAPINLGAGTLTREQIEAAAFSPLLSRTPVQCNQKSQTGHLPPLPAPLNLPCVDSPSNLDGEPGSDLTVPHDAADDWDDQLVSSNSNLDCAPGSAQRSQRSAVGDGEDEFASSSPAAVTRTPIPKKVGCAPTIAVSTLQRLLKVSGGGCRERHCGVFFRGSSCTVQRACAWRCLTGSCHQS